MSPSGRFPSEMKNFEDFPPPLPIPSQRGFSAPQKFERQPTP